MKDEYIRAIARKYGYILEINGLFITVENLYNSDSKIIFGVLLIKTFFDEYMTYS